MKTRRDDIWAMTSDWYQQWVRAGQEAADLTIFFVVGCQKSGTTWLQSHLDAHPNVCCHGESHVADVLSPLLHDAFKAYNQSQINSGRMQAVLGLTELDLRCMVRSLTDAILVKYLKSAEAGKTIHAVGDRTPEHAVSIGGLVNLYPSAKFVHVIRDGRDGAVSGWAHLQREGSSGRFATFADYAEYFAGRHWKPYIDEARAAGAKLPGQYLELRYESLHEEPQEQTRRLLEFLGVDSSEQAIEACIAGSSFQRLTGGRGRGVEDRKSHLRKGIVGDWRNHFDEEAASRFEARAGVMLCELGYAA